ncbi:zinc knuckle CX2CX4HX4C containing protein [Tanacetum coccineum]
MGKTSASQPRKAVRVLVNLNFEFPSKSVGTDDNLVSNTDEEGLNQSPLVSPTAPLPPHQSNVNVAAIFGVLLTMVGYLEVLIKDIDAGKHEELLSRMTNDKRKVVTDALGAMCDLIEALSASKLHNDGFNSDGTRNASSVLVNLHLSSIAEDDYEFNDYEILIYSIDDVAALFHVPLNSPKEIDEFTKDLEVAKYALWSKLTKETRSGIIDIIYYRWDALLNMQKSAPIVDDSLSGKASPSDLIVQYVDINTKLTFYAGAAGASAKDQPKVNSNFRPLVVDPVFDGVNISIPHKVIEKAKYGLKRIMMNTKGFFFFEFDSRAGLEAVFEGGPWLIRNSLIILKKWSMDTRLLKEELIRILIWVKLHDIPLQVFEEDGISLIVIFIGKPIMLDSYTSSKCNDSWGRSSFARCLIEVNLEADLVDVVTIGIPSLTRNDFTKETIHVEYEWRPPKCDLYNIFGHVHDHCAKKVVSCWE